MGIDELWVETIEHVEDSTKRAAFEALKDALGDEGIKNLVYGLAAVFEIIDAGLCLSEEKGSIH